MAAEEPKQTLPVNDPEAGYISPDPGASYGTGTLPPEEQEALDARAKAYEEEKKAVEDHEDEVAKKRAQEAGGAAEEAPTTKSSSKTSGSASS